MQKYFITILIVLSGSNNQATALQCSYPSKHSNQTSIVIPCHSLHAIHLTDLLKTLEKQTLLPFEVVISLSDTTSIASYILDSLEKSYWTFPVTLIKSKDLLHAGQNRNIACDHASGDILVCQDADDIPHPQRVEIIEHFFNTYNVDLIMHGYHIIRTNNSQSTIKHELFTSYNNFEDIPREHPTNYAKARGYITNGNISVRKKISHGFKWPEDRRSQDTKFNAILFNNIDLDKRIVIFAKLYAYRQYLSSNTSSRAARLSTYQTNIGNKEYLIKVIENN